MIPLVRHRQCHTARCCGALNAARMQPASRQPVPTPDESPAALPDFRHRRTDEGIRHLARRSCRRHPALRRRNRLGQCHVNVDAEIEGRPQRVRDEALPFGPLQRTPRLRLVGCRRHYEADVQIESRELRKGVDALESAIDFAPHRGPHHVRCARNRAERENEAGGNRADEHRLGRPAIAGSVELSRRCDRERRQVLRNQEIGRSRCS